LWEVRTKALSPRSTVTKEFALTNTATEDEANRPANITADNRLQFRILLSDDQTEATTWSLADMEGVTNQLETEINGITSNQKMRLKTEFYICLIEFEDWWQTFSIQALWNTIEQHVIHCGYPKMHLVSYISESIR
jgi:hypothetical protein